MRPIKDPKFRFVERVFRSENIVLMQCTNLHLPFKQKEPKHDWNKKVIYFQRSLSSTIIALTIT